MRDGLQSVLRKSQLDVVVLELLLILLDERVLRLGQNTHERRLVQLVQHARHRQASDELRNQPVQPEDLVKYGLIPEFVGRLPVTGVLADVDEAAILPRLTEPENS